MDPETRMVSSYAQRFLGFNPQAHLETPRPSPIKIAQCSP